MARGSASNRGPAGRQPSASSSGVRFFSGCMQDIRHAVRSFRRSPGFAAIAICTLAFGIGGNTIVFTMVDASVLRSLPYHDSGRILAIDTRKVDQPELDPWTSDLDFLDFRART